MAVLSHRIYSPQNYLKELTNHRYTVGDNPIFEIHKILSLEGLEDTTDNTLWDYPLSEISEIVSNDIDVVLVDVSAFNDLGELIEDYRWFEVPSVCYNKFL